MDYIDRIRNAYTAVLRDLGGRHGDYVSLTDLRPYIGGYREQQDAALNELLRDPHFLLIPESNQKMLTQADWDAALWAGGQWKHIVAFER